jgi:hypothetical protein
MVPDSRITISSADIASTLPSRSDFPSDILLSIFRLLAIPELGACSKVFRMFNLIATPLIYKVVLIDLGKGVNPLLNQSKVTHVRPRVSEAFRVKGVKAVGAERGESESREKC